MYNKATQKIEDFEVQSAIFDFSSTKVHSVLLDKAGNLWIGLFQKGVFLSPNHTNKFNYWGSKSFNNNLIVLDVTGNEINKDDYSIIYRKEDC